MSGNSRRNSRIRSQRTDSGQPAPRATNRCMMNAMVRREGQERLEGQERREGPPSRRRRYGEVAPKLEGNAARAEAEARWKAGVARDRRADGEFVYAVRSTGIYCRPSCPSRKPTRSRVEFFDRPDEAEREGFRACKRCRPKDASAIDPWKEKIQRACVYLTNIEGQPSLATLARRIGGSPYHLQRNFKRIVGVTPREFADATRLT